MDWNTAMAGTWSMEPFRTLNLAAMRAQTLTTVTPFHVPPPLMMSDIARAGPYLILRMAARCCS